MIASSLILVVPLNGIYADTTVAGVATTCANGLASCSFTLSDGSGNTGTASTSAFIGGYVGQSPLPFSGGSVAFRLPGEALTSYAYDYSGQAVLDPSCTLLGSCYQITGTFYGTDTNTGDIVTGSTYTVVSITGHSGRGGGNTYTLSSGSISITTITTPETTSSALSCQPSSAPVNSQAFCTITVTDTAPTTPPVPPSGAVTFASSGAGAFTATSCTLAGSGAVSTCAVSYTPSPGSEGTDTVTASYAGDTIHLSSSASTLLGVVKRDTSASLYCPGPFHINRASTCTVTLVDISPGTSVDLAGTVKFTGGRYAHFSPTSCSPQENNDVFTCSVSFIPTRPVKITITATYSGSTDYAGSKATQKVTG